MPPCLSLRDWHQGGKSTPPVPCAVHLSSRPRFLHFTLNHHNPVGSTVDYKPDCRWFKRDNVLEVVAWKAGDFGSQD